ncbi:hypothetical protein GCM10023115_37240 [Pontixanthobacter gangjinensis]|uniref:DUF1579 domain-containing protein n=1 Tax=Christiangramia aestuarii TaxID=1028746 RepID=A0A7K1LQM4_9FLAO|nr:hypothetical protein [Christiangramia aestuarii]MUP43109.1 hypothetical protein [Christiangramia aestuarii]
MKSFLFFILFCSITISCLAQNTDCACYSKKHQQFDFWVGNWEVFNEEGEKIGENLIKKLEDNCILNENWKAEDGSSGKSYNYYDPSDNSWNQLWLSNSGNILKLKGKAIENKMVLKSEISEGEKGKYYNQITWTKNEDGSVTQLWEIYDLNNKLLDEIFRGTYRKKVSD